MKTFVRLGLAAVAGGAALALASPAMAAYTPQLLIAGTSHALNGKSVLVVGVGQDKADDQTARIDINVPAGYRESFTQAAGTTIGILRGTVIYRGLGDAEVAIEGTVKVEDPASYVTNTCAPGAHTAVWLLEAMIAGTPFRVPIYVDDVTNVPGVSARLQICLAAPVAASDASLLVGAFTVEGVFTNPSARSVYSWSGVFTPFTPGTPTENPAAAVEARGIVPLPIKLTLRIKKLKARGSFLITGKVDMPGNAIPAAVQLWGGPSANRLSRKATVRTKGAGAFSSKRRVKKTTVYQVRVDTDFADARDFGGCGGTSRGPAGCVAAAFTAIDQRSNVVRARVSTRRR